MKVPTSPSIEPLLELLEPRIAPAVLVNGANLLGGGDNPASGETSMDEDAFTAIKVKSGLALVWFDAATRDITGISLSNGANIEVFGDIRGDVVTNLTAEGRLSDSDADPTNGEDGNVLLANSVSVAVFKTISDEGSVGNIIVGGNVTKLTVEGKLSGVYAGNGVFDTLSNIGSSGSFNLNVGHDINPLDGITNSAYSFTSANSGVALKSGASINKVSISNGVNLQIIAGDGLVPGGIGGSVSNVSIQGAVVDGPGTVSYRIVAGDGADGVTGGSGGSILNVVEKASSQFVYYQAGNGGDGSAGNGGNGGSITKVSAESDQTSYIVTAGNGGQAGATAGNGGIGGSLVANNFTGRDPSTGIVVSGEFTGDAYDDLIVVDPGSGQMALMQNDNGGTSFTQLGTLINGVGIKPKTALAADIDSDGDLDLVVAYASSSSVGVFLNDGLGVFTGSSFSTGLAPVDIAVGNFLNPSQVDIAILSNSSVGASVGLASQTTPGTFVMQSKSVFLGTTKGSLDLISARVDSGSLDDLFVGYENGQIRTLLATGDPDSLFTLSTQIVSGAGKLSNLDVNSTTKELLAFSSSSKSLVLFSYSSGILVQSSSNPSLSELSGQGLVARFGGTTDGNVQVLTTSGGASKITEFEYSAASTPDDPAGYEPGRVISYAGSLKTFISTQDGQGIAALTGSLSKMAYNLGGNTFASIELPFDGKSINLTAGNGGNAIVGKGGAGGSVDKLNAETTDLNVFAGSGGNSTNQAGGTGGSILNSGANQITADSLLELVSGSGGNGGTTGGNAGGLTGLILTLGETSEANLVTGNGGNGSSGNGGHGGSVMRMTVNSKGSEFNLLMGDGGDSASGKAAGNGGGVTKFTYKQELGTDTEANPLAQTVQLAAGNGGIAAAGKGGVGGSLITVKLTVDPPNIDPDDVDDDLDSTQRMVLIAGAGGDGAVGGAGGGIGSTSVYVTLDQKIVDPDDPASFYIVGNYATLAVIAGNGGNGTVGNGGNGGSVVTLKAQNLTQVDSNAPAITSAFFVAAGSGGDGALAGGKGGSLGSISASNGTASGSVVKVTFLTDAVLTAGTGGTGGLLDGGLGGSLGNIRIGVQSGKVYEDNPLPPPDLIVTPIGGTILALAGAGGDSVSGKGGNGGGISKGVLVSVNTAEGATPAESIRLFAGAGGDGLLVGGMGGSLASLNLNTAQQSNVYGSVLIAGQGGNASSSDALAKGGAGGNISTITQAKDLNSSISLLQAGNGGDGGGGTGGKGGSVGAVKTAGFIGRVFDDAANRLGVLDGGLPQGIFAGLGGAGAMADGFAGSIANIVARQISALGGAQLPGGTFGLAASISNVKADLIGYSTTGSSTFSGSSPTQTAPTDGFLLAQVLSGIKTYNPTRTDAFTFTS